MTLTPQEGRAALDRVLTREVLDAEDDLQQALAKAARGLKETQDSIDAGRGIPTSVTGGAMIVPENVNALGTRWMEAQRRRARLLAVYDDANGTVAEV